MLGELHGIDGELDVHVALDLAAAGGVDKLLGRLGDDGVAVVIEPVDQRADRGKFLILDDRGVVERPQQRPTALEFLQKALIIDVEAESFRRRVEIGPIDEERDVIASKSHLMSTNTFANKAKRAVALS